MTPKRPRDPNQLAKSIIEIATGQKPDRDPTPEEQGKDPAAVALGRAQILHLLCEGQSIRVVTRLTGCSKNTVAKLLVEVGHA